MIRVDTDAVRTFLHLLAASVWVGGQIVLAGIAPKLRREHREALASIATAFARVAWTAMAVVVITGLWGLAAIDATTRDSDYLATLLAKMVLVGAALAAVLVHQLGTTRWALAIGGAVGLLGSVGAMLLGVVLVGAA